jgi:glycosyltransferase involved in cell wall biosynthesis
MGSERSKVVMGFYFYPRGGSAHACRAIATGLVRNGIDVTLVAGSRSDRGERGSAREFFAGIDLLPVDFTPALESADPLRFEPRPGAAPMHASFEDRPGAEDPFLASLDDDEFELQVRAWGEELQRAGAAEADVLYLHHLTPLNEAAARVAGDIPVVGHVHGSELLMLEAIDPGPPAGWPEAESWAERFREWASACARIVVNSEGGAERAWSLLEVEPERVAVVPNGVTDEFAPRPIDRRAHWRRHLVEEPQGWAPGEEPGSVRYRESDLEGLDGTTLLSVGRFTAVKRLGLLIEAFAAARPRFRDPAALVLLGGYPGEWEGEHPLETVQRLGVEGVFLAGWHPQSVLPDYMNASDLLVHPSANEQFGQVLVEAMACGLPTIAAAYRGPKQIVDDGRTGWLIPPDDLEALSDAIIDAVDNPGRRRAMGRAARLEVREKYTWSQIGERLAALVREVGLAAGASRA